MPFIERREEDKELFRLWYECLTRSCKFWAAYHVLTKSQLNHTSERAGTYKQLICEACSLYQVYQSCEKDCLIEFYDFIEHIIPFIEIHNIGFDAAWDHFKGAEFVRTEQVVVDVKNIFRHELRKLFSKTLEPIEFKNIYEMEEAILRLPIFGEDTTRINLSIYPFGLNKKELTKEIMGKVFEFSTDKKNKRQFQDQKGKWVSRYTKKVPPEIGRYLGVFDIACILKTKLGKDITFLNILEYAICENFEECDNAYIKEARIYYRARVKPHEVKFAKNEQDMLGRDYRYAEELIKNAALGFFPKYSTSFE